MSDAHFKFAVPQTRDENEDDEWFVPPAPILAGAHVRGIDSYRELYSNSINNADEFWKTVAKELYFEKRSEKGLEWNFDCRYGSRTALLWEGNEPGDCCSVTFQDLFDKVVNFSAVLRSHGVKKGDVVVIYLPMALELPIAMLSCARIGVIHAVVFAGFSADALAARICQTRARILITADGYYRGKKLVTLKAIADNALVECSASGKPVEKVVVVKHLERVRKPNGTASVNVKLDPKRDVIWEEEMKRCKGMISEIEWNNAEDPLFILYTSGSTGQPKGIVHTTAGYMIYTYATVKFVFNADPEKDIYWCTADCGWITGHSYLVYGPLLNGLTCVIYEGVPTYPTASRMWQIVEKYKVTTLYTAPTAVRSLMAFGDQYVTPHNRSSLRLLASVGEPINPAAWKWLYKVVGESRCVVIDTYWQTETGGHTIAPLPAAIPCKPGCATLPFFGIEPVIIGEDGGEVEGVGKGTLCFKRAWPGISRTILGDHGRFTNTYFSPYPGYFFTGDGVRRDADGYYWITGRIDDLMNVSGHLLSTAEIESALVSDDDVVETAVVAAPHDIKGSVPYAFVTLRLGVELTDKKTEDLKLLVRKKIGAIAVPDVIQVALGLPKTRSGKVTRRILRKIAEGDKVADLGDTTTLIDETVIAHLWNGRSETRTG
uniref:Acetyl-coenzyme A synthetase n=1 Tax=Elaeophora elaphi TaxID=1147741 RepID=A0A0R3RVH8_9BILA